MSEAHCKNRGQWAASFTVASGSIVLEPGKVPCSDFQSSQDRWRLESQTRFGPEERIGGLIELGDPSPGLCSRATTSPPQALVSPSEKQEHDISLAGL